MRAPVQLLVITCLIVGIIPGLSIGPALAAAARPVVGGELPIYSLAVWHGFTPPLVMSLVAIFGGIAGYLLLRQRQARGQFLRTPGVLPLPGRSEERRLGEGGFSTVSFRWS